MTKDSCVFCKIVRKDLDAKVVYQTDTVLAFEDVRKVAPVHVLVIPKLHIPTLNDIDQVHSGVLYDILFSVKAIVNKYSIDKDGYRLVFNCNPHGGQTVYHIHAHIIGGMQLGWPPYSDQAKK